MFTSSQYKLTLMRSGGNKKVQYKQDLYANKNEEYRIKKFEKIISCDEKGKKKAKEIVSKIGFD